MDYQSYEDYMRSVLGYSPYLKDDFTYQEPEDMYSNYEQVEEIGNNQDVTPFYPEIYKMVYPMVCKACNINESSKLTKELLEQMIDEIYKNIEPEETVTVRTPLKNGDVINPNSKDPKPVIKETRGTNYLLRDLIKILLLREWQRPSRPPVRPPYRPMVTPPPPPPRPGNNRPPIMPPPRPRYY